jgi:DnaJ like chaperone protein
MACVIKADGKVLKSEINFVKPFLLRNFGEQGAKQALLLLRELLKQDIDVVGVSQDIAKHVNYSVRLQLIHLMLDLANADDDIDPRELEVIEQMVTHMQVQWSDYQSMLSLYQRHTDPDWAYTALEITPQATDDEVKRAYRRMAMKYHPDKVATAGEDICRQATEKFRAINEAYGHIKQLRNMP